MLLVLLLITYNKIDKLKTIVLYNWYVYKHIPRVTPQYCLWTEIVNSNIGIIIVFKVFNNLFKNGFKI